MPRKRSRIDRTRKQSCGQKVPVCGQEADEYPHTGIYVQCGTIMNVVNRYALYVMYTCTVRYNHECCESVCTVRHVHMHSAVQS